ncbi:carboxypeptidase-like regulatory domain-containing protein [Candidatus Neomarinimicrobiota bacterium]
MTKSIRIYVMLSSVFALVLSLSAPLWGGTTGKISGRVTDAVTGEPLPGANVVIQGTTMGGATDTDGFYFVINVAPGTYTITATMMGYETVNKTDIIVSTDRTITIDYPLSPTVLIGQEVTVLAEREIVQMDVSSSQVIADIEQVKEIPFVTDVMEYANLQAGIENDIIRGGGLDQTAFMMDGLMVVDNRANKPLMMVNLSSVQEISIIMGGFSAEYGNVRSGLINVITKESSPNEYHGSVDFQISPARLKHDGASIFDPDNYYLRPYLDPGVMWVGTENGTWDEETQKRYRSFIGWNDYSAALLADGDPDNDRTPEECRDLFLWMHRAEGSDALGQKEGPYGHKPDWNADVSLSGPVPLVGKLLGNMSFFVSYRNNWEMFGLPVSTEYFKEQNLHVKLTSRLSTSMKLQFEGLSGVINTVQANIGSSGARNDSWVRGGDGIFGTNLANGDAYEWGGGGSLYWPDAMAPFDVYRSMMGLKFDHILSPSTFYSMIISNIFVRNDHTDSGLHRDRTIIRYFGNTPVDEAPYGFYGYDGTKVMTDGMIHDGLGRNEDRSKGATFNVKFDLTSQINRNNEVKIGFVGEYNDMNTYYQYIREFAPSEGWEVTWRHFPYRFGAYVQDKLEFEGMIANFGLRLDYNQSNTEWYTVDRYSKYFRDKTELVTLAPTEPAQDHLKISPRLGISHPISEDAKLFFNYGHFYSMPNAEDMYAIRFRTVGVQQAVSFIGNPSAEIPRTVQYELGFDYNIADMFLIHLAGYYKDVGDQTGTVGYTNYDNTVSYSTIENKHYADIRGFELRLDKRFGRWIKGWLNYNYIVTTSGYVGRQRYYQDPRDMAQYGLENPYQEIPVARPITRANVLLTIPEDWGPTVAGIKPLGGIMMSMLFHWKAGHYQTWDPLETYVLKQNLQWKDRYYVDARFSKAITIGRARVNIFADISNLFNIKYIADQGFADAEDKRNYLESLHLPMYKKAEYKAQGYTGGDDKPGDVKSDDKPYIDMPDRGFLTYLDLRSITFGMKFEF